MLNDDRDPTIGRYRHVAHDHAIARGFAADNPLKLIRPIEASDVDVIPPRTALDGVVGYFKRSDEPSGDHES
ncbi:MAG TPA: hypothetical protein PLP28_13740, partial [Flavobacteriales bacterium]|nr:hypothetical protein [Flavobacteriales bacterium]